MIKIICVCGSGLGTSLLAVMGIKNVLKKNGYKESDFIFDQADLLTGKAAAQFADLVVTTPAFKESMGKDGPPAVFIKNLFSEDEIEEKLIPVLKKVIKNKKD